MSRFEWWYLHPSTTIGCLNGIWDGIWDLGLEWEWDLGMGWDYDKWDGMGWDGMGF